MLVAFWPLEPGPYILLHPVVVGGVKSFSTAEFAAGEVVRDVSITMIVDALPVG